MARMTKGVTVLAGLMGMAAGAAADETVLSLSFEDSNASGWLVRAGGRSAAALPPAPHSRCACIVAAVRGGLRRSAAQAWR